MLTIQVGGFFPWPIKIPPEAAAEVADLFDELVKELRDIDQLHQYRKAIKAETKKRQFTLHQIPVRMQECLDSGMSFEDAVFFLRSTTGAPQATIYHYWLKHIKNLEKQAFEVRERQIMAMYQDGQSNNKIADAVELSSRQVGRIIREYKEKMA